MHKEKGRKSHSQLRLLESKVEKHTKIYGLIFSYLFSFQLHGKGIYCICHCLSSFCLLKFLPVIGPIAGYIIAG
jgi:hypothetical protein